MKKIFLVKYDYINSRLDRWFKKNVCDVPQSLIEKNIRKGNIKINYKNEKSSYKLKEKDQIIIYNVNFIANKHKKINILCKLLYVALKSNIKLFLYEKNFLS